MYLQLSDGWMVRRSDAHEVWTPTGWQATSALTIGDKLRGPSGQMVVVESLT